MKQWTGYWWGITDPDSELCGEEFLTALEGASKEEHEKYVKDLFPFEKTITCYGRVTEYEADMLGLDTY